VEAESKKLSRSLRLGYFSRRRASLISSFDHLIFSLTVGAVAAAAVLALLESDRGRAAHYF